MLFKLFFLFTKIGIFTIGGGYAVIPLIEKEIISRSWLTYDEFYELLAITESLPGVFATNIAALVCSIRFKIHPILILFGAAVVGLVLY